MEMIKSYFFRDMGVMLGRSMRHMHRSIGTIIAIAIMPIAVTLLFLYIFGRALLTLEEAFLAVISQKAS